MTDGAVEIPNNHKATMERAHFQESVDGSQVNRSGVVREDWRAGRSTGTTAQCVHGTFAHEQQKQDNRLDATRQ